MTASSHMDPSVRTRSLSALAESLDVEVRLLRQLAEVLRDQREGVARDDVETVDDSVHAAHRVMQTLAEARRRRGALLHLLTDREDVRVAELAEILGEGMTDGLATRLEELEDVARAVSREVSLNRSVLVRAIRTGHEYVQRLVAPAASGGYGAGGQWNTGGRAPALVNQRV